MLKHIVAVVAVVALAGSVGSVQAGGGGIQIDASLSGPALNGFVPSGRVTIDETRFPFTLRWEVKNINLPDGSEVDLFLNHTYAGTITLVGGQGKLEENLGFQVHFLLAEVKFDGVTIMTN